MIREPPLILSLQGLNTKDLWWVYLSSIKTELVQLKFPHPLSSPSKMDILSIYLHPQPTGKNVSPFLSFHFGSQSLACCVL